MEKILNLVTIIFIVFAILQIILFFKVWRMTNDVKDIHKKLNTSGLIKEAKIYFLKGQAEKAKDLLDSALYSELLDIKKVEGLRSDEENYVIRTYANLYELMNLDLPDTNNVNLFQETKPQVQL